MIEAIALDDEPPALEVIESFCSVTDYISLVKTFTRADEAMKYMSGVTVDLLFLDINMPTISGIDLKKQINPDTMVIFTTAYSEFAIEGFNVNAIDYLLKPFTPERFLQAVEKAKNYYQLVHQSAVQKPEHITIRADYALVKVPLADIIFIEGLDDYLKIHVQGQKPVISRMTMKAMIEKLPPADFVRIHRSYIVALDKIETVRNKIVSINGERLPIGTSYENKFYEVFKR